MVSYHSAPVPTLVIEEAASAVEKIKPVTREYNIKDLALLMNAAEKGSLAITASQWVLLRGMCETQVLVSRIAADLLE